MDPDRKRKIRLVIALGLAVVLAAALVYTSFSASTEAKEPSELLAAGPGQSYDLTGRVADGSVERDGSKLDFEVADREDPSTSVPVTYTGTVPDPFREGREVIVTGELRDGTFVAEKDSLITKCPSKFAEEAEENPDQVIIE
ncbi:MAG TPA: cytochrome c maturation protein CcmE [Solirubrobacterales bacterium]